jgi:RNA polymerase sigma-70 factor (ECF subfamily)
MKGAGRVHILGKAKPVTIGFVSNTVIDDSPDTRKRVKQAVVLAQAGDRDAFQYLYAVYARNIYGYVRSIVRDDHAAEDVTQQVFAKLITHLDRYDDRGVQFFAWLLRIAHNLAVDHLRGNRLIPTESVVDPALSDGRDQDSVETVRDALATLPEDQREVVFLRHVVGLTPGEIANRLGKTESSVHGLHHRGRRALQRELSSRGSGPVTRSRVRRVAA